MYILKYFMNKVSIINVFFYSLVYLTLLLVVKQPVLSSTVFYLQCVMALVPNVVF